MFMQVLGVAFALVSVALAIGAIQARRNIRGCCGQDASRDLRMRDAQPGV